MASPRESGGAVEIGRHHADEVVSVLAAIGFRHLDAAILARIALVGRLSGPVSTDAPNMGTETEGLVVWRGRRAQVVNGALQDTLRLRSGARQASSVQTSRLGLTATMTMKAMQAATIKAIDNTTMRASP
jgi:hypothetical protein